ncbi:MAG: beta galactosidase jelly roll domain-containing protein [Deferribacteres bacterium]|nr:beta galactosidase jelly roll domain-containing protein [candidate division KSB1 bacterium]MCB9500483.1 beta galactosidase jelly roll domain-containing protein [Deferribacteres bacterium]
MKSKRIRKNLIFILFIAMSYLFSTQLMANQNEQEFERYAKIVELRGVWKFAIGDDSDWSSPSFDDSDWSEIFVPSDWEDEGYAGYDGIAWYRKKFKMRAQDHDIYSLLLGYIDDSDEVWINGRFVGSSGEFPPGKNTAYDKFRSYLVPADYLNFEDENTIAVRVYDRYLNGGIVNGTKIGLFVDEDMLIPLAGEWQFKTIDYNLPKDFASNPGHNWRTMFVPRFWDEQGLPNYDGFAWYRKSVVVPSRLRNENLILVLGKIDDFDETYFNGQLIGGMGFFSRHVDRDELGNIYQQVRIYEIPAEIINYNGENTIDVRVFDGYLGGGIYEGPVGITTPSRFHYEYKEPAKYQPKPSIWDALKDFFDN